MGAAGEVSVIIAFSAGILTFLSPCVLPLIPSYLTFITGKSFEDIRANSSKDIKRATVINSLFFILGFSVIFVLLGVTMVYLGSFFGIGRDWLEKIAGVLVIFFGLHIAGIFNIKPLNRERQLAYKKKGRGYVGSFVIGMAFAIGWTPCVGPILASILAYASTLDTLPRAAALLFSYSLGLGVPFIIAGLALNHFLFLLNRFRNIMRYIPVATGILLVIFGVLLFTGQVSRISGIVTG